MRKLDASLALLVAVVTLTYPMSQGDPLFLGTWYYFAAPAVVVALGAALRVGGLFLSGSSLGLTLSYLPYWYFQGTRARPEGLLGLAHLFSLPGALVGLVVAAIALRREGENSHRASFAFAIAAALLGLFVAEATMCAARMACGPLSFVIFYHQ